ncbi:MAG TPA: glycosyltransferase family 39 protein [Chloroflexia bacterium]|nr:glycosyltransferase family 39 protein [Chloroflexia bacterium]
MTFRTYRAAILLTMPILLVTLVMGLLGWRVSADEELRVGTEADRVYLADGFYAPEQNVEHGIYRWTQPLAQLVLPNWGPGRIHVKVTGIAGAGGDIALKLEGTMLAQQTVTPGQEWTLEGWGDTSVGSPHASLESQEYSPPGEGRSLGLLVEELEIYAPYARLRAWLAVALLGLAGILLYAFLRIRTGRALFSMLAGACVPLLYGPLAAYRDPWTTVVAWVAPVALGFVLLLHWRSERLAHDETRVRRIPRTVLIVITLCAALVLLYLGYMNAFDSDRMYQVSAGIAEYGRPTRYPGFETWTKYGFGQPLIAVPFYWLGKVGVWLGGELDGITRLTVSFTNLIVTGLTLLLLYRAARRFASVGTSLAVAATYLLATPALNYGRTFFSEPAGGLFLLASILLILPDGQSLAAPRALRLLLSGLCLGAMLLFKPAFAVYWPAVGLAVLWLVWRRTTDDRRLTTGIAIVRAIAIFGVGPILALVAQGAYNYIRYAPLANAIFRTGYEKEPGFSTPLLEGLGGLLFSPGKSVFLYAPVLILVPIGLWLMFRRGESVGRLVACLIVAEIVAGFGFNAMWWAWTGNFAWGSRLIVPVLPLMVWALAFCGRERATEAEHNDEPSKGKQTLLAAWIALGVLGTAINIAGTMVDFQVYFRNYGLLLAGDPGEGVTLYDPANSAILVEARYLWDGLTAAVYRPSLASVGMPAIWDVLVPGGLVLISVACLWGATRVVSDKR